MSAFKLSKQARADLAMHIAETKTAREKLEAAVDTLNEEIDKLVNDFNGTFIEIYNQKLEAASAFIKAQADEFQEHYDDRSDSWRDGERGQEASDFMDQWAKGEELQTMEPVSVEAVELDAGSSEWADEVLEQLPEEVG